MEWHGREYFARVERDMIKRITRACIFLEGRIKQKLDTSYPPASKPGDPPHLRSGELRRSITRQVDKRKMMGRVGTNKVYSSYVEKGTPRMAARPFIKPTLRENQRAIKRILVGKKL